MYCHVAVPWLGCTEVGDYLRKLSSVCWQLRGLSGTYPAERLWLGVWFIAAAAALCVLKSKQKKKEPRKGAQSCHAVMGGCWGGGSFMLRLTLQRTVMQPWCKAENWESILGELTLVGARWGASLERDVLANAVLKHQLCLPSGWRLLGTFHSRLKANIQPKLLLFSSYLHMPC